MGEAEMRVRFDENGGSQRGYPLCLFTVIYFIDHLKRLSYYFQMQDQSPFAFAGIWDEWQGHGNSIASCAIITTTANELLASIHDRMPVILRPESHDLWLNDDSSPVKLRNLLAPFPTSEMTSHAVSYDVNHTKIDDEHLVRPVELNLGVTLSLF